MAAYGSASHGRDERSGLHRPGHEARWASARRASAPIARASGVRAGRWRMPIDSWTAKHQAAAGHRAFGLLQFGNVDVVASKPASSSRCCVRGKLAGITSASPMRSTLAACGSAAIDLDHAEIGKSGSIHPLRLQQHGVVGELGHRRFQVQAGPRWHAVHGVAMASQQLPHLRDAAALLRADSPTYNVRPSRSTSPPSSVPGASIVSSLPVAAQDPRRRWPPRRAATAHQAGSISRPHPARSPRPRRRPNPASAGSAGRRSTRHPDASSACR